MNATLHILSHLLETADPVSVKEISSLARPQAGEAKVKRFGRWKVVDMPDYQFLISYLTPVAYFDKRLGVYYSTSKQWSRTTNSHIRDWQRLIYNSPEWQSNPENKEHHEPSEWRPEGYDSVVYPSFKRKRQAKISALFRELMRTMQMKPRMKRRMYHVDPKMRVGSGSKSWLSGHLKHHHTGREGLPDPSEGEYSEFFKDFEPDRAERWNWWDGPRDRMPHEPDE